MYQKNKRMKQIFQNLKTGEIIQKNIPIPKIGENELLIQTRKTLVSLGTEKMLLEFGRAGWLEKAKSQPEKVKQVLNKIKTDGLKQTIDAVKSKIERPLPIGYSNVGVVIDVGKSVTNFRAGDRVASNGFHAEVVSVSQNLCVKVSNEIDDLSAVFVPLASVSLQSIRLLSPTLGESFAVIGLGLVGLITIQILKANGCRVIGFDIDDTKIKLAEKFGVKAFNINNGFNVEKEAFAFSKYEGVDGVIVATSTKDDAPLQVAPKICRKKGRVILVGTAGLNLNREEFYKKEIIFQVSCSYGVGRYETNYEDKNFDYPIGFVRWTVNRNFETVLNLIKDEKLDVKSLISHTVSFEEFKTAYKINNSLGIVFDYKGDLDLKKDSVAFKQKSARKETSVRIGVIGAGNYVSTALLPALSKVKGKEFVSIASKTGINSNHLAEKFKFSENTTNYENILLDENINSVIIATRHNLHSEIAVKALKAKKHIFLEKPPALNLDELNKIEEEYLKNRELLFMVGYNRRFSPHIKKIKDLLKNRETPLSISMTINAGRLDENHWLLDKEIGGGRIIGEVCHFIDLMVFITNSKIEDGFVIKQNKQNKQNKQKSDEDVIISLTMQDGSIGNINYFTSGDKSFSKERIEIFSDGRIILLDNFKKLFGYGFKLDFNLSSKLFSQDKGQKNMMEEFVFQIKRGGKSPIPFDEIKNVSMATFKIVASLQSGTI